MRLTEELNVRMSFLISVRDGAKKTLKSLPKGKLIIDSRKDKPQYYRSNRSGKRGKYIKASDIGVAQGLAQADYLRRVLKATNDEITKIEGMIRFYSKGTMEDIADKLHPVRKNLIMPVWLSDEEFVADWLSEPYEKMGFAPGTAEYYTTDKERMRSKSEVIIAEYLKKYDIPYQYEFPLWLNEFKMVRPDFKVLNVRTRETFFWEHLGKMGDPEYAETNVKKIEDYINAGLIPGKNLILTLETSAHPLNSRVIDKIIEEYLI